MNRKKIAIGLGLGTILVSIIISFGIIFFNPSPLFLPAFILYLAGHTGITFWVVLTNEIDKLEKEIMEIKND